MIVEGPIGAGKSTYVKILKQRLSKYFSVSSVEEPVELWERLGALDRFYKNPKEEAYRFQMLAYATRMLALREEYEKNPNVKIRIVERSPRSDHHVFVRKHVAEGNISASQYEEYKIWCKAWEYVWPKRPDCVIYVAPPLEECMKRVRERSRDGEDEVSRDYQIDLMRNHEDMFRDHCHEKLLRVTQSDDYRPPGLEQDKLVTDFVEFIGLTLPESP